MSLTVLQSLEHLQKTSSQSKYFCINLQNILQWNKVLFLCTFLFYHTSIGIDPLPHIGSMTTSPNCGLQILEAIEEFIVPVKAKTSHKI